MIIFQKDDIEKLDVDPYRTLARICAVVLVICFVWGIAYMPVKHGAGRMALPSRLAWMVSQQDLVKYVLPYNDTSLIDPRTPQNETLFAVVIICSSVPNVKSREAIRSTWARDSWTADHSRVYFLLGRSSNDSLNEAIVQESEKHGDIIQQDFSDTYNNLTIKSVMLLKWILHSNLSPRYIMKTDDDMFVHLPNLFKVLREKGKQKLLLGCLIKGASPIKDRTSKWFVPDVIFSEHTYPPYLSGTGYVMSYDVVPVLYSTALDTPFFYLEDVFITGICARRAGLKPENNNGFNFSKRKNDTCVFRSIVTAHKMSPKELHGVWNALHHPSSIKCKKS